MRSGYFLIKLAFQVLKNMANTNDVMSLCVFYLLCSQTVIGEPKCSKYDYEEQVLYKMVRLEFQLEQMKEFVEKHTVDTRAALKNFEDSADAKIGDLARTFDEMKTENNNRMNDIDMNVMDFKKHHQHSTTELNKVFEITNDLNKTLVKLSESVGTLTTDKDKKKQNARVLFRVRDKSSDSVDGKILKFATILRNDGNGFDQSTGKFRAPVAGIYQFNFQVCVTYEKAIDPIKVVKVHNGIETVLLSAKTFNKATGDTFCSFFGVTDTMEVSDTAWVTVANTGAVSTGGGFWTSFSGALVSP